MYLGGRECVDECLKEVKRLNFINSSHSIIWPQFGNKFLQRSNTFQKVMFQCQTSRYYFFQFILKYVQFYLSNYLLPMRRFLSEKILRIRNYMDQSLDETHSIDPKINPKDLVQQIRESRQGMSRFIRKINSAQDDGGKLLHKYMIVHLCLIHNQDLCEQFQKINFKNLSKDEWLNINIISPYCLFLQKVCFSQQTYKNMNTKDIIDISFQRLFFIRKVLFLLLTATDKLPNLGSYCQLAQKRKDRIIIKHSRDFVNINAYHSQILYSIFKAILGELLQKHQRYVNCSSKVRIMKYILKHQVQDLNERMKNLFLNKKFCPIYQGYTVKLFRLEDVPQKVQQFLQSTIFAVRAVKRQNTLDSIIFDRSGRVNENFMHRLREVTLTKKQSTQEIKLRKIRSAEDFTQHIENV